MEVGEGRGCEGGKNSSDLLVLRLNRFQILLHNTQLSIIHCGKLEDGLMRINTFIDIGRWKNSMVHQLGTSAVWRLFIVMIKNDTECPLLDSRLVPEVLYRESTFLTRQQRPHK